MNTTNRTSSLRASDPGSIQVEQGVLKSLPNHGLQSFGKNIWVIDGPDVRDMGIIFTTRMTIVKLHDGSLWVSSPVNVSFDTLKEINALGPVRYILAATPRHVWRLEAWHTLFPEAQLWISRITSFTLKKGPLPYAGILSDTPPKEWMEDLEQLVFKGSPFIEEVLFFHKESHTLIMDDLIQNHRERKGQPLSNALLKLLGVTYPSGGVARDMRLAFTNRSMARLSLNKLLSWDFDKLIIAHGDCVVKEAKPYVKRAFRWLTQ